MDRQELISTEHCGKISNEQDAALLMTVKGIISRGNDAEIRKKGDGYIVLEVEKKTKYCATLG